MAKNPPIMVPHQESIDRGVNEWGMGDVEKENDALKNEIESLKAQLQAVKKAEPLPELVIDPADDDRNDVVEVTYGAGAQNFQTYKMPKKDAVEALVNFYINRDIKIIPYRDLNGKLINSSVCYIRFTGRDAVTGDKVSAYKDAPLNLVAERIIDHPRWDIQLVPKAEYERAEADRIQLEMEWMKPINQRKIRQAIETLASQ